MVRELLNHLPTDSAHRTYYEPFLGGGALFFALRPKEAVLADANEHLIRCYEFVRDNPDRVNACLRGHARDTCEVHYYEIRDTYNRTSFSAAQAARFIYLNKTCFNGIFRVNIRGDFNVPYGWKEPPSLPSLAHLRAAGEALGHADLVAASFEDTLRMAGPDSFVFLDPPYPPLNGTSYFTHYTADRFGEENQRRLAAAVGELSSTGAAVMMTNADLPIIRKLYRGFHLSRLSVTRSITCKKKKHHVGELIITNY